ncbi:hypothetical protein FA15DRAFT_412306 [Coprinopsis marcescibilis]|uniref:Uncharacterized protein n=1 Tax=Coprinopsis marcescibilis TaxID=230819 RepID=A0A5C3KXN3_COPMA|nr:hypothetical protein FA15DRAFT_412306 [Coprinopsis marcescibilis]
MQVVVVVVDWDLPYPPSTTCAIRPCVNSCCDFEQDRAIRAAHVVRMRVLGRTVLRMRMLGWTLLRMEMGVKARNFALSEELCNCSCRGQLGHDCMAKLRRWKTRQRSGVWRWWCKRRLPFE